MLLGGISKKYMLSNSEINKLIEIGNQNKMYTHGKSNDTQLKLKNKMDEW